MAHGDEKRRKKKVHNRFKTFFKRKSRCRGDYEYYDVGGKCGSRLQGEEMMLINCNNAVRLLSQKQKHENLFVPSTENCLEKLLVFASFECLSF